MNNNVQVVPDISSVSHVRWGAIFAGTVAAIVSMLVLALLGIGIGLSSVNVATGNTPTTGLGIGAAIWWVISSIISLFFGGWITSRFAGVQRSFDGFLHGFVTWGVTMLFMVMLLTNTVGAIIGGGMSLLQTGISASGSALSNPRISQQVQQQLGGATGAAQEQKQQEQKKQQEQGGATGGAQQAQQAVQGASAAAFGTVIMMVLGALAASFGGKAGRVRGPVKI